MIDSTEQYFISLLRAVLEGGTAEPPHDLNASKLFDLASRHHLLGTIAAPLEAQSTIDENLRIIARKAKFESIRNDTVFMFELNAIENAMEQAEIPILTLKGPVIKSLYPQSYQRSMSDLDFLYHKKDEKKIISVLTEAGYTCSGKEEGNHLLFSKPPVTQLEFHPSLLPWGLRHRFNDDDWAQASPKAGKRFIYEMSNERYYEYLYLHLLQHFLEGGVGARFIMDIHVFGSRMGDKIDRIEFEKDCAQMGILTFVHSMEMLEKVWFSGAELDATQQELTEFILEGGLYGKAEHRVAAKLSRAGGSRLAYFFRALFEPLDKLKTVYPSLNRASFLFPLYYFHRIPKRIMNGRGKARQRLASSRSLTAEQVRRQQNLFDKIGI